MRLPLTVLAILPLLQQLPEGYVPSEKFEVETRCNTCNKHWCECPAPEEKSHP